jgi:HEAT repeat protein
MFRAPPLPRTLEAALRDLGADRPSVRAEAVRDLGAYAEDARERVIGALQKALRDTAPEVRARAATTLADIEGREALAELSIAVEDDDALVRQMAIAALGEIGDARATERLRRALADARPEVRFQAVMAFPRVSASREAATDALLAATRDEDGLVCHIALRMAEELAHAEGGSGEVDARFLDRARALVKHASPEVRVASAILLARAGDDGAASGPKPPRADARVKGGDGLDKVLDEIFAGVATKAIHTSDREDEAAAIELCGERGISPARAGLERRAFGGLLGFRKDPLAWHARVALARMGHERACREILREIGARDRDVCTLAVAAAGRARLVAAREQIQALRGADRADPHALDEALAALDEAS